jgi:hypothetical protein
VVIGSHGQVFRARAAPGNPRNPWDIMEALPLTKKSKPQLEIRHVPVIG